MRILVWNIERGYYPAALAKEIQRLSPDLALISEVDRDNRRTNNHDIFSMIAEALKMPGEFAQEFEEIDSIWRRIIPTGGPGGGLHGNAVYSNRKLLNYRVIALPTCEPLSWQGKTIIPELFEPRRGQRIAQAFELEHGGRSISVISTHLENWRCGFAHRRLQLERALEERRHESCIIAGDFNPLGGITSTWLRRSHIPWEVREMRALLEHHGLFDPFLDSDATCFNMGTRAKLDWLALSEDLKPARWEHSMTKWSDHAWLMVEIESGEP
jgi:endonuclease/exonuclease/phosphatase family metal-dependent hydrolase